jgi:hypothetical protein
MTRASASLTHLVANLSGSSYCRSPGKVRDPPKYVGAYRDGQRQDLPLVILPSVYPPQRLQRGTGGASGGQVQNTPPLIRLPKSSRPHRLQR